MAVIRQNNDARARISRAVRALCPIIDERIKLGARGDMPEIELRRELIACILGSQVRFEMAVGAMSNLEAAGVFDDDFWSNASHSEFSNIVADVLGGARMDLPCKGKYRFHKVRSSQIAMTRSSLLLRPLTKRFRSISDTRDLRSELVKEIPGLGPKQASMFLRNVGRSYDLAILDSHVIRFMEMHQALPTFSINLGSLRSYEVIEDKMSVYAKSIGYPVGYLDWAIWATMKAARELKL